MASVKGIELPPGLESLPPTQDELPYSDGEPTESERHVLQMTLLIETLRLYWKDRPRGYAAGNMAVYFSAEQLRNQDFRAPDFFAVVEGEKKERKSWVLWEERRGPDVVVELLSESTQATDRAEKKQVYQDDLRVPEYFWYEPFDGELAGFRLSGGRYKRIRSDEQGRLYSARLGLWLGRQEGTSYQGVAVPWLRWMTEDGQLLPTQEEAAAQQQLRAEQAEARARQLEEELQRLRARQEPPGGSDAG